MDVVSKVLLDRSRELGGLERMIGASVIAHVGLIALFVLAPAGWWGAKPTAAEETLMVISLTAGPPGPRTSITPMPGRPIQTEAIEPRKAIEPVRPPAAREPEMVEPKKAAPKKAEAKIANDPKDPKGRTPTRGEEVRSGSAVAETGGRGQGFGLSQGGFGGSGSFLDVANFCCPEYLATMENLIRRNWDSRQQMAGRTQMRFTIQRNGMITDIALEKSSGYQALDFMAQRALVLTRQLPPLPAAFPEPTLPVHLVFEYHR